MTDLDEMKRMAAFPPISIGPETILALIERLEKAERDAGRYARIGNDCRRALEKADARISELEDLIRVLLDRDPYEKITDPDAGQWNLIDEWRHRASRALGGDHE